MRFTDAPIARTSSRPLCAASLGECNRQRLIRRGARTISTLGSKNRVLSSDGQARFPQGLNIQYSPATT